jgi:hypothetical protein
MLDAAPLAYPCHGINRCALATVAFSLPRLVHIRGSFLRSTMACKYQNQYRYNDPKAAVALDLPLELFAEKNLANAPWQFGYAAGGSHILASAASAKPCTWCRRSFAGGAEMYGGLGDRHSLAPTTNSITPDRSSPGPFPGSGAVLLPKLRAERQQQRLAFWLHGLV